MLYRAVEGAAEERNEEGKKFCLQLVHSINSDVHKEEIPKVKRLWRSEDDYSQLSRPILIQLVIRLPLNQIVEGHGKTI